MNTVHSAQTQTATPRVTVFIPAFNAERHIAEAIESMLAQSFTDFELLIIDDGSTDGTREVIAEYSKDPRLRFVVHDDNRGQSIVRNEGLDLARGEYIAFIDADDRCSRERLDIQVAYLDAHPDIAGVGSWMPRFDENGHELPAVDDERDPLDWRDITCHFLVGCPIAQGSMMIRGRALSDYRYDPQFAASEDHELWSRMIQTCRFSNLPLPLTQYRRHASQATTARLEEQLVMGRRVFGRQAAALGLDVAEQDLMRHECLFRFQGRRPVLERTGQPLDINYVRWARAWLEGLLEGNDRRQIYPEPTFSHMLAERWLFVCRKGARSASPRHLIWREFMQSTLKRAVWSLWRARLHARLTRKTHDPFSDPAIAAWIRQQSNAPVGRSISHNG